MSADAHNGEACGTTPLDGLTVVDLSTSLPGAFTTQFLADAGADVVQVEPPGGSPLRAQPGWPGLARGKRSIVLDLHDDDLHDEADRATLDRLLARADVLVTTSAPATLARLGLTAERLADLNPRLVSAAITGWGMTGPWRDLPGYEGMVLAKLGYFHVKRLSTNRPGPAFVSVPYASWGAAQTALHGILAALIERETSGRGQRVEADLVRGVATIDTWNWFSELVGQRWPDAFTTVNAFDDHGQPQGHLIYPLLVAATKDGYWLQFAQTQARLFQAMLQELDMAELPGDPKWKGFPQFDDRARRVELWEIMLRKVGERTLAEWEQVFATNPNVSAEVFRSGPDALAHAQLVHDGRVVTVDDPAFGPVRQPSTLVHVDDVPLSPPRPAPGLDEHAEQIRAEAAASTPAVDPGNGDAPAALPLAGVTVLELSSMYAAPYGATLLTDLGARVFKIEPLGGDQIRTLVQFPEAGGAKVMQGKESIAVDMATDEGLAIVHELARRSDIVLQSYRAGAAERARVDPATLKKLNPDLVYLSAPGYGTGGPYGGRPAYAPSIGAASGLALTDAPDAAGATGSLEEIKKAAVRLNAASAVISLQGDGIAALGVGSAMLLGLLARRRGRALGNMTTTMLSSATHALIDRNIDYAGRPAAPRVDPDGHGFGALYRMYRAADGWVFLAAPAADEWEGLATALRPYTDLAADARFASPAQRADADAALADVLGGVFATKAKADWEAELTAAGVGCVAVAEHAPELTLMSDEAADAGYHVTAMSPVFDEHRRPAPATRFSRSVTKADGGCLAGDHTDALLQELGYDDERIADLHARNIVT
ncbi:CaiB/BaiF CoA transferase family protein [Pseudonocardia kunmingensis]|uniref:Dimethylsulfoniopropionate cleavage enzyme DddD n=1 Tax=Pseudonocardia kunmingensis TaxID=630975 RepID=A0A543DPV0_9PSEU|nr:CoA transferase [Pseudonocardia kunmingensis]TQM11339.1 dimethylsulfoniopropionate cleavage enzyme DddD [Pseudonocardia kunmingensis]